MRRCPRGRDRGPAVAGAVADVRDASAAARGPGGRRSRPRAGGSALGLHLVKGIGEEQQVRLDAELIRGPYADLADVVERTGLAEEVVSG